MPHSPSWRQLVPGLVVVGVLLAFVFAVFRYARVGALRGDTLRLYAFTDHAAGLAQGSEVWLGGRKVGLVRTVGFAPPASDTARRVLITSDVLADYREQIRRDSYAEIHPGGSLIGAPVLTLSVGTPRTPALGDGDTITSRIQTDLEAVTSRAAVASRDFPAIIANVKLLAAQLGSVRGTVGAMLSSETGGEQFSVFSRRAGRLAAQMASGRGTVGRALHGDAAERARHAAAELDTLRTLLASQRPGLGGFRRDSTLLASVQDLRNEVTIVRALLNEPRGTAGRVLHDEAVQQELTAAEAELSALVADMKARPYRYVTF